MASSDRKLAKVGLVGWLRWSACTRNIREWLQTMEKARHNNWTFFKKKVEYDGCRWIESGRMTGLGSEQLVLY